jgi:hypothetical protein
LACQARWRQYLYLCTSKVGILPDRSSVSVCTFGLAKQANLLGLA